MQIFTVSLFGHREVSDLLALEDRLAPLIGELLKEQPYVSFLIGRSGEFDEFAASVIKRVRNALGRENSDLTLVLPYSVTNIEYYERYYDGIIIPESVTGVHPKAAIGKRNRWMVEQADLVVVCVERTVGGAYAAFKYARTQKKSVINLGAPLDGGHSL